MNESTPWHKSTYSNQTGGHCVEVSEGPVTRVRDTRHRESGVLAFPAREWWAFVADVRKAGNSFA